MKLFAQFHRRETIRYIIKINNLEEKVEPPLSGVMGASFSGNSRDDGMEVEESAGLQDKVRFATQFSLGGVAIGN